MVDADKPNIAVTQGPGLMSEVRTRADAREISDLAAVIDVKGEVTAASESVLMSAYERAIRHGELRESP
jgi:hypothetical protein